VTDTVIVRFEGDGSGVAELGWGQYEIWCVTRDKSDSLPIGGVRALTWGGRRDMVIEKRFLCIRHTTSTLGSESQADSRFVRPADMAALIRRTVAVLVGAAVGDTALEGAALGDTAEGGTRTVPAMGAVR
jgi:hypothetical protein